MIHSRQYTLDAIRLVFQQVFDERDVRQLKPTVDVVALSAREIAARCEVLVYGSQAEDYERRHHVPADWWSHFKLWAREWNPKWWRRALRWFVWHLNLPKTQELVFTAKGNLIFPTIQVDYPSVRVVETNLETML